MQSHAVPLGIRRKSQKFAETRWASPKFDESSPKIRRMFGELRGGLGAIRRDSTNFDEIRRNPAKVGGSTRGPMPFGENSPKIRRTFAEHSTDFDWKGRHPAPFAEFRRNSPKLAECARLAGQIHKIRRKLRIRCPGEFAFAEIRRNSPNLLPAARRRLRRFSELAECSPNIRRTFGGIRRMTVGFRSLWQEIRSADWILRLRS